MFFACKKHWSEAEPRKTRPDRREGHAQKDFLHFLQISSKMFPKYFLKRGLLCL